MEDLFADAVHDESELRALYDPPSELVANKEIDHVDEMARRFIACTPLVFVASVDETGRCDVTPRGGPPGFVAVLDGKHLAIPDATGNRRIDTYRNVVRTGHVGLIFVIPGRGQTLRVNGPACVSTRASLLDSLTAVGKPPRVAMVVRADEVFTHCPKAFVRSGVWKPESWPSPDTQPSEAEILHAHVGDPGLDIAEVERHQRESILYRLA